MELSYVEDVLVVAGLWGFCTGKNTPRQIFVLLGCEVSFCQLDKISITKNILQIVSK